jgi:glucokinase
MLASTRRPSPTRDAAQTLEAVVDAVQELRRAHDVAAVGVAAAGFVDAELALVMFAPNLAWRNEPLREEIVRRTGLPVVVENDANAVAWAEARFGAGRDQRHLVALTVGTGTGGGIVVDGALQRDSSVRPPRSAMWSWIPGGDPAPADCRVVSSSTPAATRSSVARRRWRRRPRCSRATSSSEPEAAPITSRVG